MANYLQNLGRNWPPNLEVGWFDRNQSTYHAKESKSLYQIDGYHCSI
jgi:hypothetical protein